MRNAGYDYMEFMSPLNAWIFRYPQLRCFLGIFSAVRELMPRWFVRQRWRGNLIQTLFAICSAVRNANAARVSVGLAVAPVGNVPLPTKYRVSGSCERWNESTTDSLGLRPMR